jgi:hypothetical protein
VSGDPDDLDLGPDESAVGGRDGELGGFGDDRGVGPYVLEDLLDAEAGVLLVGDGCDDDLSGQAESRRLAGGDESGGEAGLHVVGAAGVQAVAVDGRHERGAHLPEPDGVGVAAQHEGPAASRGAAADHDAGPARRGLESLGGQVVVAGPLLEVVGDLGLARRHPGRARGSRSRSTPGRG